MNKLFPKSSKNEALSSKKDKLQKHLDSCFSRVDAKWKREGEKREIVRVYWEVDVNVESLDLQVDQTGTSLSYRDELDTVLDL